MSIAPQALIYDTPEEQLKRIARDSQRVNFGILYGQTAYGLSKDLSIAVTQAQDFIDAYFLRYPKVRAYVDQQVRTPKITVCDYAFGRRRYIPEIKRRTRG
jgi:DNA polymerase-1